LRKHVPENKNLEGITNGEELAKAPDDVFAIWCSTFSRTSGMDLVKYLKKKATRIWSISSLPLVTVMTMNRAGGWGMVTDDDDRAVVVAGNEIWSETYLAIF
jgi:hypothetical protein